MISACYRCLCAWHQRPAPGAVRLYSQRKISPLDGMGPAGHLGDHFGHRAVAIIEESGKNDEDKFTMWKKALTELVKMDSKNRMGPAGCSLQMADRHALRGDDRDPVFVRHRGCWRCAINTSTSSHG